MAYADESAALAALSDGTAIPADLRQIVVTYPNLRAAVAAYPGTDEAMLGWLGDLHDPGVDAALAARARPPAAAPAAPESGATRPLPSDQPAPAPEPGTPPGPLTPQRPTSPPAPAPVAPPGPAQPAPGTAAAPVAPGPITPLGPAGPAAASPTAGYGPPVPVAAGPPGPPTSSPAPPAGGGRGPGMRIAIIAVIVVLLVGGGVLAAFAAGLVPGFGSSATPAPTPAPASPDGEQASAEPTVPPPAITPTPIAPTPIAPPPVGFACWDTSEADSLAACPSPQSREQAWQYLRYVYPSLARHENCTQSDSTGKSDYQGVTVMWECELGDSLLRYRYWVDPGDAERHYGRKFKDSVAGTYDVAISGQAVEGWVKTSQEAIAQQSDGSQRYVATMWLPELQLSMSAEGNDTTAMWNAFELVRIRPLEQVNGHQLGVDPSGVPLTIAER